jgi:hypothetical protein
MRWKTTRLAVRDVAYEPRIDDKGVRGGWLATTADVIASRMFYPDDMFTYEPK